MSTIHRDSTRPARERERETAPDLHEGLVRSGTVLEIEVVVVDATFHEIGAVVLLAVEPHDCRHLRSYI